MNEFVNRLNKVKTQLAKLDEYRIKTHRRLTHFQLRFDAHTNDCHILANYSNRIKETDLNSSIISSLEYMSMNLLATYLQMYVFSGITSIIIECDIDEIGVIIESLQVRCKFKRTNWGEDSSINTLSKILQATVEAEVNDIPEKSATCLSFRLLRGRLRSISLITDFKEVNAAFDQDKLQFSPLVMKYWQELLELYESRENARIFNKISGKLNFDLSDRQRVVLAQSLLYPDKKVDILTNIDGEEGLESTSLNKAISQFKELADRLPNPALTTLDLARSADKLSLAIGISNQEDSSAIEASWDHYNWEQLIINLLALYTIRNLSSNWVQKSSVTIKMVENFEYLRTDLKESYVQYIGPKQDFNDYPYLIKNINKKFENENAKIWKIVVSKDFNDLLDILKIYFTAKQVPPTSSDFAMDVKQSFDDSVVRTFELSERGFMLAQEDFLAD
ncbi:hypothetical protein FP435_00125 (plasmid) [Lactobacillus sp. PV037]|uniref:hypothetical protein n=1 Tax=Lactobacillus sp. PV037 TaxID=2594496 RepID=UPI00223F0A97|nr:hypothetical protein [Lactobacillus sp. PV037]QNQ82944.1 hypothetical protein FP435_00125 [Lactobacillus sp. PV037]